MTDINNYIMANNELIVSDERKNKLLAAMNNANKSKKVALKKFLPWAAIFLVLVFSVPIVFNLTNFEAVKKPSDNTSDDIETASTSPEQSIHFNSCDNFPFDKIKMFEVFGEEFLGYDSLPQNIKPYLPVAPVGFVPEKEEYHILYSEEWEEFSLDTFWYNEKDGNRKIAVCAGRRKYYYKSPLEQLKPSKLGNFSEVYFLYDEEKTYSIYYFYRDIWFSIHGKNFTQEQFVSSVLSMMSKQFDNL